MSTTPLCSDLYPNVAPLSTPLLTSQNLPLAPQLFTKITSLSLPALFPSSEIPNILKQLHRCLKSSGRIHLTIVNPSPVNSALGPLLRQWLEENLLLNLEKSFRCQQPSRLFPLWLADAHLRGDGSTITMVKFMATTAQDEPGCLGMNDMADDASAIRTQLRSLVGRMLWLDAWGQYVHATKWWWEDPDIMDECSRLGTFWEFHLIEAVKSV